MWMEKLMMQLIQLFIAGVVVHVMPYEVLTLACPVDYRWLVRQFHRCYAISSHDLIVLPILSV